VISDYDYQVALQEYQEWGEKLSTPREVRIARLLPQLSEAEIQKVMKECSAVETFSWEIAEAVRDAGLSSDEALQRISIRFPFMSEENLARTFSQAMYYTLK
jgi:hypothetical protein